MEAGQRLRLQADHYPQKERVIIITSRLRAAVIHGPPSTGGKVKPLPLEMKRPFFKRPFLFASTARPVQTANARNKGQSYCFGSRAKRYTTVVLFTHSGSRIA